MLEFSCGLHKQGEKWKGSGQTWSVRGGRGYASDLRQMLPTMPPHPLSYHDVIQYIEAN